MIKLKGFLVTAFLGAVFLLAPVAARADGWCFCSTKLDSLTATELADDTKLRSECFVIDNLSTCSAKISKSNQVCSFFSAVDKKELEGNSKSACLTEKQQWEKNKNTLRSGNAGLSAGGTAESSRFIPECLLKDELSPECRDVSVVVYFGLNVAKYLFTIIGALVLVMFVYGGFTLILSQGSPEKVKKGGEIIVAAVIGLVIVFGAYMLVSFLGEAAGVKSSFQLK